MARLNTPPRASPFLFPPFIIVLYSLSSCDGPRPTPRPIAAGPALGTDHVTERLAHIAALLTKVTCQPPEHRIGWARLVAFAAVDRKVARRVERRCCWRPSFRQMTKVQITKKCRITKRKERKLPFRTRKGMRTKPETNVKKKKGEKSAGKNM